ncbi:MAG: 30S ribosomal protein S6 [Bacteroidota bacterium]|nr:30S ribosomal protein S6 [Bacteroidota bacterium]
MEFAAEPTFAKTLETQFRRDERIIRFLTFSKDKHAVAYSEKRISRTKAKTEKEN